MNKKPFGLSIAVKTALEAIKEGVAPPSVALTNLFYLQKSKIFPKSLDVNFFITPRQITSEVEKKILVKILDELKLPNINKQDMLEKIFSEGWVFKKSPPKEPIAPKKTPLKNKSIKQKTVNKDKPTPTVIIKKSKLV